ncbi:hypothetical protein E2562_005422 [Oryza meyeriana var. granulata]|uniref:Uncharacterized protein n=1 Tax=Oryza meyeriana var. granulata TaxID=110450 RepID=A0A6G1DFT5_9ORYZ|nr:hypothetical protein E2562_005422 [Oryza meyeriana var. granulata]
MLHSLDAVAAKKKRKQSLAEGIRRINHSAPPAAPLAPADSAVAEMESPIHMIPLNEVLDMGSVPLEARPPETRVMRGSTSKKRKKLTARHASTTPLAHQNQQPLQSTTAPQTQPFHDMVMAFDAAASQLRHFDQSSSNKEQVYMAIGRFLYDANPLYELLKNVVEEVGEKNVVQCIDGMLEDFSKVGAINEIICNAKAITGFIYNSAFALNLMKRHLHGKDLLVPAETRAAMNFVTLKNMQQHKAKAFDPVSVDNIDIVDDWVVDRSALVSGQAEQSNWTEINQPVNNITSMGPSDDDEFESFIEGVDDEIIQGASRGTQEDDE